MIIVSDTSPVSNLILIERLDILRRLFDVIIVPPAVDAEIRALKQFNKDLREYENAEWIKIITPLDLQKVQNLQANLDEGEAQAIALASEIDCELLLMDERLGTASPPRRTANRRLDRHPNQGETRKYHRRSRRNYQ